MILTLVKSRAIKRSSKKYHFAILVFSIFALLLGACSTKETNKPSKQTVEMMGETIPYHKYTLDNGLTVILHLDDSDPLVNVNVTYHVGSAKEDYGRSGFAHFFEHMMFQGSQHVADEEHFKIITEAGGSLNGTTNTDRTNYYQTVPANQLEKILWLEADRMGFFLPAVTQEKFENQRETVKNERAQRVDNQPYGLRFERTAEALYPKGHPYSWSTIGYVEDLDRVNLDDLKAFFQRWYGPNNAVLTIGGDIDIEQTKTWIEQYFGSIPKGPAVKPDEKQPAKLESTRYITLEDKVHLPLVQVTYPTVYLYHPDEAPLDVLANILGQGKTSLLYKNMVKNGLAVQAFASHPCRELACEFTLLSLANPQNVGDLKSLNTIIQSSLAEFEERGVQDDDLQRVKSSIETSYIYGLQSVEGKVNILASNQIFKGEPDSVNSELERYRSVTKEDVMRVYKQYIKGQASVVLSVVPKGQAELAVAPQSFDLPKREIPLETETAHFIETPVIVDTFDRSIQPTANANKAVKVPEFWQHTFDNGINMLGVNSSETPTVSLTLKLEGGVLLDPIDKVGLASLTASLMNESTNNYSGEAIENELSLIGSSIVFDASGRYLNVYIDSLTKHLDKTLALAKEKMMQPAFSQADFDRVKERTLQAIQQSLKNPSVLASRGRNKLLYGEESRLGLPDIGTLQSVQAITLDDVRDFYQRYFSPQHAVLVSVGDIDKQTSISALSFLNDWKSKDYTLPSFDIDTVIDKGKIFIVDNPGGVQSVINIFRHAPVYDPYGEQFKLSLSNYILGGMFNSRINLNLREDKGYTYGARSRFSGGQETGVFVASADVSAQFTKESIQEFLTEIQEYQSSGMTDEELQFLKSAYTQSDALKYETPRQKAGFLSNLLLRDLDKDFTSKQQDIISNISKEELNALAKTWLNTDKMHILVVGDANTLKESLSEFDREIEVIQVPR